jgi:hypothetical protein
VGERPQPRHVVIRIKRLLAVAEGETDPPSELVVAVGGERVARLLGRDDAFPNAGYLAGDEIVLDDEEAVGVGDPGPSPGGVVGGAGASRADGL